MVTKSDKPKKVGRPTKPLPKAKPVIAEALTNWLNLNDYLMKPTTGLDDLNKLMEAARKNNTPDAFIVRIQRRINRLAGQAAIKQLTEK